MSDEKYRQIYLEWSKEVLIDHLVANIHNGEILLNRIETAIDFIDRYLSLDLNEFNSKSLLEKLKEILSK